MIVAMSFSTAYAEGEVVNKGYVVKDTAILIPVEEYNEIISGCTKCLDDLDVVTEELKKKKECPTDWSNRIISGLVGFGAGVTTVAITLFIILVM